jgi:hypothetical protein
MLTGILIVSLAIFFAGIYSAQDAKSQEPSPQEMEKMLSGMMGPMMESMMKGMLKVMAKPESAELMAAFSKNYYDALIDKGFPKDAALKIVISSGMPSMPMGR